MNLNPGNSYFRKTDVILARAFYKSIVRTRQSFSTSAELVLHPEAPVTRPV